MDARNMQEVRRRTEENFGSRKNLTRGLSGPGPSRPHATATRRDVDGMPHPKIPPNHRSRLTRPHNFPRNVGSSATKRPPGHLQTFILANTHSSRSDPVAGETDRADRVGTVGDDPGRRHCPACTSRETSLHSTSTFTRRSPPPRSSKRTRFDAKTERGGAPIRCSASFNRTCCFKHLKTSRDHRRHMFRGCSLPTRG